MPTIKLGWNNIALHIETELGNKPLVENRSTAKYGKHSENRKTSYRNV